MISEEDMYDCHEEFRGVYPGVTEAMESEDFRGKRKRKWNRISIAPVVMQWHDYTIREFNV